LQYPSSPLHSGPFLIYLTARSAERGAEAVKTLNSDPALKKAKVLAQDGGETTIKFQTLDISDVGSIHAFRDFLKKEHPEGIDVVINNAGIAMDGFSRLICSHDSRERG
jgi:carbonyl reductase 1